MTQFSTNVASLQPSATIAVSSRAKALRAEGADIVDLTAGEPDFPTPDFIAQGGIRSIQEGRTGYTPAAGLPALREAIARDLHRQPCAQPELDPRGVVVTSGAKQALFNACFALFGPGDRVLVPVPYWTTYPALVGLARAETVFAPPAEGLKVTPADLDRAADGGAVRGLLLNSPCNPSGAVYSRAELEALLGWAAERSAWVVSDEIYRRIHFGDGLAPGALEMPAELLERVVVVDGASKAFAMTGWRLGFSYSSPELADKMAALQSQTTSNASAPAQYAALAAYSTGEAEPAEFRRMRDAFHARRDLLLRLFRERLPGVEVTEPRGAFYLWFRHRPLSREGEGSIAFCERAIQNAGLALVPGEAFGDDRSVRLSFAASEDALRQAVERLASLR